MHDSCKSVAHCGSWQATSDTFKPPDVTDDVDRRLAQSPQLDALRMSPDGVFGGTGVGPRLDTVKIFVAEDTVEVGTDAFGG